MKDRLKQILLSITIFILYFSFSYIVDFILKLAKIDLSSFKYIYKIIFIYSLELIPLVIMILIYKKDLKKDFKEFKLKWLDYFDKYIRYWLLGMTLMAISNIIIGLITGSNMANNEEALREITNILPIYSIISSCICAPIVEELAYRKTLGNIFSNKKIGIIIGGFLFGLAHIIGTYTSVTDILYIIPYGVIGGIFMFIYLDSKNIFSTISLHFLHNTILLIAYFISLIK